ncbi:MAG: hypothetical protein WB608_19865, partial [Terracidiphilus sp.]
LGTILVLSGANDETGAERLSCDDQRVHGGIVNPVPRERWKKKGVGQSCAAGSSGRWSWGKSSAAEKLEGAREIWAA